MGIFVLPTTGEYAGSLTPLTSDSIVFGCGSHAGPAVMQYVRDGTIRAVDADAREVKDITSLRRQLRKAIPAAVFIEVDALGSGMAAALVTQVFRGYGPVQIADLTVPASSADPSAVGATYLVISRGSARASGLTPAA